MDERGGPRTPARRAFLTALALLLAGAAVGGALVYAVGSRGDDEPAPRSRPRVQTIRDGEVVVRPAAGARCEASGEGGVRNLYCTHVGRGRYSVAFYDDTVLVYGPRGDPTVPDFTLHWKLPRVVKACGSISVRGRRLLVDIAEGRPLVPCASARAVMRQFVATASEVTTLERERRVYACHVSPRDDPGWDFHCLWNDAPRGFADLGAGRRFR